MKSESLWIKTPSVSYGINGHKKYFYIHKKTHHVVTYKPTIKRWVINYVETFTFPTEIKAMKFADTLPVNKA